MTQGPIIEALLIYFILLEVENEFNGLDNNVEVCNMMVMEVVGIREIYYLACSF